MLWLLVLIVLIAAFGFGAVFKFTLWSLIIAALLVALAVYIGSRAVGTTRR